MFSKNTTVSEKLNLIQSDSYTNKIRLPEHIALRMATSYTSNPALIFILVNLWNSYVCTAEQIF